MNITLKTPDWLNAALEFSYLDLTPHFSILMYIQPNTQNLVRQELTSVIEIL